MVSGSEGICACGAKFTTGSTSPTIAVEVCSNCHPLCTGQQKFLDTAGRVEKFNQRVAMADRKKADADDRKGEEVRRQAGGGGGAV